MTLATNREQALPSSVDHATQASPSWSSSILQSGDELAAMDDHCRYEEYPSVYPDKSGVLFFLNSRNIFRRLWDGLRSHPNRCCIFCSYQKLTSSFVYCADHARTYVGNLATDVANFFSSNDIDTTEKHKSTGCVLFWQMPNYCFQLCRYFWVQDMGELSFNIRGWQLDNTCPSVHIVCGCSHG